MGDLRCDGCGEVRPVVEARRVRGRLRVVCAECAGRVVDLTRLEERAARAAEGDEP